MELLYARWVRGEIGDDELAAAVALPARAVGGEEGEEGATGEDAGETGRAAGRSGPAGGGESAGGS
jgi:hypothetical protein